MDRVKEIAHLAWGKLPLFVFCVVFVQGYTLLCGSENTIVSIGLLTAGLIYLKSDIGLKAGRGALVVAGLLALSAVAPYVASFSPWIGLPVNFVSLSLIVLLACHDVEKENQVPFMLLYIFCQGYPVEGQACDARLISVCVAASIIGLIYYLVNRKKDCTRTIKDLFGDLDIHHHATQWYIKLVITLTLVMFLGSFVGYPRTMWISFCALSLIQPTHEMSAERLRYRLPSTIIGSVLFFVLFAYLIPQRYEGVVALCVGFIMMFMSSYSVKTVANAFSSLFLAALLFSPDEAVVLRIVSNIIGVVIVVASHLFFKWLFKRIGNDDVEPELDFSGEPIADAVHLPERHRA